jgi:hypothetical protein
MRQTPRPYYSRHRLARLNAWARLWLTWFLGTCVRWWASGARPEARDLDWLARGVARLVINNAVVRLPAKASRRPPHRHGRLNHRTWRAFIGSRLRRALRGRDWPSRLAAILAVARDLEAHVAAAVRRLGHGLSRLRIIDPKRGPAPLIAAAPCGALAHDDSS